MANNFDKIERASRTRRTVVRTITYVLLTFWALMVLFPYYWMLLTSVKSYRAYGQHIRTASKLQSVIVNDTLKTIEVNADSHFGEQLFTPKSAEDIYAAVGKMIAPPYKNYQLIVKTGGWDIRQLVPTRLQKSPDPNRLWGDIDYTGRPWVSNASLPYKVTKGLQNRHLSIWASHGRYYNLKEQMWRWQRPALFGTREDLFTQTIVTPYLIPMLEKAGAVVFTPRERDWQKIETVVDNDQKLPGYSEQGKWKVSSDPGFGFNADVMQEGDAPFTMGTAKWSKVRRKKPKN